MAVTTSEDRGRALEAVEGWRRCLQPDPAGDGRVVVNRPPEGVAPSRGRLRSAAVLRHPSLARVIAAGIDEEGARVVEQIGDRRPLSDERRRLPRGDELARELVGVLEALAYIQRQGMVHGAVSRETIFSDGRTLLLTGVALGRDGAAAPSDDVRAWAEVSADLVGTSGEGGLADILREAASQVRAADEAGHALDAPRVVRAINRAFRDHEDLNPAAEEVNDESVQSRPMKALTAALNFLGNTLVGLFTTLLTFALIGAAVGAGVLWFLDQLPQEVPVPNVEGMPREEARERLEADGLKVGHVRSVYREEVEPGHVAETVPPPGMTVREGREITLVVSMGAARVAVPRLLGLKLDEAKKVLEKKGLRLVDGGRMHSDVAEGEIVQQEPPPDRKIAQGQRVVVQTSGGPEFGMIEVSADDDDEEPKRVVFRRVVIVVPRGDALQRVQVREGYGDDLETTYDRLHRPGDRIKLDTYGRPGKQVRVTIEGEEVFKTKF